MGKYLNKLLSLHGINIIKGGEVDSCNIDPDSEEFKGGVIERAQALLDGLPKIVPEEVRPEVVAAITAAVVSYTPEEAAEEAEDAAAVVSPDELIEEDKAAPVEEHKEHHEAAPVEEHNPKYRSCFNALMGFFSKLSIRKMIPNMSLGSLLIRPSQPRVQVQGQPYVSPRDAAIRRMITNIPDIKELSKSLIDWFKSTANTDFPNFGSFLDYIKTLFKPIDSAFPQLFTKMLKKVLTPKPVETVKPVVVPNFKQITNGIDLKFGGGFMQFDSNFSIIKVIDSKSGNGPLSMQIYTEYASASDSVFNIDTIQKELSDTLQK